MASAEKIELFRAATKFVIGTSVGTVVSRAVKSHVPAKNVGEEIQILVGAYVLAGMAADRALDWADAKFEETRQKLQQRAESK